MINLKSKDWVLENIETVIFDKDGTFIDLHFFWGKMTEKRAEKVSEVFGLQENFFEKIGKFLGYDVYSKKMLSDGITALYSRVKIIEIFRGKLEEIGVNTTEEKITEIFDMVSNDFYKEIDKHTKPIEEAIVFIKKLHEMGVKLGIVTSDSVESTKLTLKNFGWEYLFQSVIGRESSSETKESGVPTKLALSELSANPETTIMVGDAPMDFISAKNAGINNTILISTGQVGVNELKKYTPYVLESLKELECLKI
jgi:pyrophosphatase PpaX